MNRVYAFTAALALAAAALVGCANGSNHGGDESAVDFTPDPAKMEKAAALRSPVMGKQAPAFTLKNQNDQPVSLADFKGHWTVLYFYPKDDTPGCACQATEFTKLLTDFHDMGAKVYGVSSDSTEAHRQFAKKYGLKLNLLSDPDHQVMSRYGAYVTARIGDEQYGRVIRSTYIIGPDGVIRYHWPEVIPEGHAERVREKLEQLQKEG